MAIILFEDDRVEKLYPVTVGKPAFMIGCGGYRLVDVLAQLDVPITCFVRPHLRDIYPADAPELSADLALDEPVLLVNAAAVPSVAAREALAQLLAGTGAAVWRTGDRIAAIRLDPGVSPPDPVAKPDEFAAFLATASASATADTTDRLPLFDYPHDVVRHHLDVFADNLQDRLSRGEYEEIADGVFIGPGASIAEPRRVDTSSGPVVLEAGAQVGPYCVLIGPAHLGRKARVIEHSAIKDGVALGHTTKIGGEIEASIIEPYTNKQHHGFMGHSYLGSWINLGAGTCNSDLKNTYGQVNMWYQGQRVPTGMQFIGCIIGDYAKTAINTGIFTGKTIGVCTMVYGFVTTNVPSFVNYARTFGQVTETPVDTLIATQKRMFARRDVVQRDCDKQLLRDMYELTRHERQLASEPLQL